MKTKYYVGLIVSNGKKKLAVDMKEGEGIPCAVKDDEQHNIVELIQFIEGSGINIDKVNHVNLLLTKKEVEKDFDAVTKLFNVSVSDESVLEKMAWVSTTDLKYIENDIINKPTRVLKELLNS